MGDPLGKTSETGASKALKGSAEFSSLQRKRIASAMQNLPTHTQEPLSPPLAHTQTLMCVSPDALNAVKASLMVAVAATHVNFGFPKHNSATSPFRNLTAMQ